MPSPPPAPSAEPRPVPKPRPRRTQAERRAATRRALLDATLDVLAEVGYSSLTTAQVVARAGVTRGAQAHYFATKADLVVQALRHLTDRLIEELIARPVRSGAGEREQYAILLDRLWEINAGPASTALIELWVASRTDPDLRGHLSRFQREVQRSLRETVAAVAPAVAARPDARQLMLTGLATIRGLWLLRAVASDARIRRLWPAARDQLVTGAFPVTPGPLPSGPLTPGPLTPGPLNSGPLNSGRSAERGQPPASIHSGRQASGSWSDERRT